MGSTTRHLVIVRSVRDQHLTIAQAATRYGLCRQWVYTLLTRYDVHDLNRLARSLQQLQHPRMNALHRRHQLK